MKELDFDELDRAVNSLITNSYGTANNTQPEVKTLNVDPRPVQPPSIVGPAIVKSADPVPQPLAGRRSPGRFMDVVPPSSSSRPAPTVPDRALREAPILNPIVTTDAPGSAIVDSQPVVSIPEPVAAANVEPIAASQWTDPISYQSPATSVVEKPAEPIVLDNEDDDIDKISKDIAATLNQEASESLDTPFLSGAKVDKRPLGAFSVESANIATTPTEPVTQQNDASTPTPNSNQSVNLSPVSVITPLPPELHNDLLSIDSHSTTQPDVNAVINKDTMVESAPLVTAPTPVAPIVANPGAVEVTSATINQQPSPTPIVANSTNQSDVDVQNTGAVYNTEAYNTTLLRPAKKKNGWLWVILIVALLIIGGAAGAAVYFFVLK